LYYTILYYIKSKILIGRIAAVRQHKSKFAHDSQQRAAKHHPVQINLSAS